VVAARIARAIAGAPEKPVKWLADENFRNAIVRGIVRRVPGFDVIRVQDVAEVAGQDDAAVLRFATQDGRIVVTHDVSTMVPAMREQLRRSGRCGAHFVCPGFITDRIGH